MSVSLKESLDSFIAPVYGKTQRSPETYRTVADYCLKNLLRLITEYHAVQNNQQLLRDHHTPLQLKEKVRR